MTCLRTCFAAAWVVVLLLGRAQAQEPIRFARAPDISPDGKLVAFSYLGDIWVVESIGGIARPVTMHEAHDFAPIFSPDGSKIAFSSKRHGSYDVFVVPVQGGKPKRLTVDSAADIVNGWSPDGKQILFASTRGTGFPPGFELYTVPVEGGPVTRVTKTEGKDGAVSPKGDQIAYVRGPGTWYRKGYRGSSNDDIWICKIDGSENHRLTDFDGQDTYPMWAPDGRSLYYVSEQGGSLANIMCVDLTDKTKVRQITFHMEDGVRRARLSGNGDWIVYECGADLWVVSTRSLPGTLGCPPARKLAIEVHADDKINTERTEVFTQKATEFVLSPDERHVAFAVHGNLFLMPISGGKATRLTDKPSYDHGIAWAPSDGKKIVFASDRDGQEDLYLLESNDPDHPKLVEAHQFKVTRLTNTPEAEIGAGFAPDGKRLAFIRSGQLWTMNPDGKDQKVLVKDVHVVDYEWSPDSKWFVYSRQDGSGASELYIIPSASGEARNVTRYATRNEGVTWSTNGKKLAFISERRRGGGLFVPSLYVLSLQKPAAAGVSSSSTEIDWDDIHLRVEEPAPMPISEGAISPDGNKVAFRARSSGGDDLWVASTSGGQLSRVTTGNLRPQQIHWSRRPGETIYFRDGNGALRMVRLGMAVGVGDFASLLSRGSGGPPRSSLGEAVTIPFKAKMTIRRDEEFGEMFEQSWRALSEYFYDDKFHGVKWEAIRGKYRPLVQQVALKEDLYALVSLMLGELNASHLGIAGLATPMTEATADLGLLWDESYRGPGLKIAEIVKRGPADKRGLNLRAADVVLAIDDVDLTGTADQKSDGLSQALNGKVRETVVLQVATGLSVKPKDPKARRRVELVAASRGQVHNLMYERWVERNAQHVAKLSHGKLGYIHIPSMDEEGLDRFVRALYSDSFDKEAIVLDVRYNGGGFTHDQVLNYLGGKEHTFFRRRGGGEGLVLSRHDRKWTKPLVLLINNRSYSDAEILPNAFRTLGLGKLVGQPTGGCVIGTASHRLIDGSIFNVPMMGVYTLQGANMENQGVVPDVVVEAHPDQLAQGKDLQLDKAVEVLQQDVIAWKKNRLPVAQQADASKPSVPVVVPMNK